MQQSFATIAPYTVEEAYEVADAIERDDLEDLCDELGDLLFQVVFHAQMAKEAGAFTFDDVVAGIVAKMIRRHPHVFDAKGALSGGADAVMGAWEEHKKAERAAKARAGGLLGDVPRALPALKRAAKLTKRAATVGFDWPEVEQVLGKLEEELGELREEMAASSDEAEPERLQERLADELGDVLFVLANLARHLRVDPEFALHRSNAKFVRRFGYIEGVLAARGQRPEEVDLATMDALWDEAKVRLG